VRIGLSEAINYYVIQKWHLYGVGLALGGVMRIVESVVGLEKLGTPYNVLVTLALMVLVDVATGVVRAKKAGEPISGAKLWNVVTRIYGYAVILLCVAVTLSLMTATRVVVSETVGWCARGFVLLEVGSILDNLSKMRIQRMDPAIRWLRRMLNREMGEPFEDKDKKK
jgi:phage-related holin